MKQAQCSPSGRISARGRQLSRKERHKLARQIQSDNVTLEIVHANAAGIDVGKSTHYVAVPPDRDAKPVRCFDSCTEGLQQMVAWLKKCGITSVALQSTGVYWIALFDLLQETDFEVYLVNARYTKSLPGRKSDVQESQWLMKRTLMVCCPTPSVRRKRFAGCGTIGDSGRITCAQRLVAFIGWIRF